MQIAMKTSLFTSCCFLNQQFISLSIVFSSTLSKFSIQQCSLFSHAYQPRICNIPLFLLYHGQGICSVCLVHSFQLSHLLLIHLCNSMCWMISVCCKVSLLWLWRLSVNAVFLLSVAFDLHIYSSSFLQSSNSSVSVFLLFVFLARLFYVRLKCFFIKVFFRDIIYSPLFFFPNVFYFKFDISSLECMYTIS